jgi:D-glycero-alpha-D-manno-heptose-7-phosphate kinase
MTTLVRNPLRVSLLGGGSDLDWYLQKGKTGKTIGFSLGLYNYIFLTKRPASHQGILHYSSSETYSSVDSIAHPLIRAVLSYFNITHPLEMFSMGPCSNGGGLGSSSSFLCALIYAISQEFSLNLKVEDVIVIANEIEINKLAKPIGYQDAYHCSLGGASSIEYSTHDKHIITRISPDVFDFEKYIENAYLINLNISRASSYVLSQIKESDSETHLSQIKAIADMFSLDNSTPTSFSQLDSLVTSSFSIKSKLPSVISPEIEAVIKRLLPLAPSTYKVLGAGLGGYLFVRFDHDMTMSMRDFSASTGLDCIKPCIDQIGLAEIAI